MNFIRKLFVGINNSNSRTNGLDYVLKFDRILDAENQIFVGIGTRKKPEDKHKSLQVIRIGDYTHKYYRLLDFKEKENKLKYSFENNIILILKKTNENIVMLELIDLNNDRIISKPIDSFIIKRFKKIGLASDELDKIYKLFNEENKSVGLE